MTQLKAGFKRHIGHSAHSEPIAATEVVRWIRANLPPGRIAIVTDHRALANGQRRWWSMNGGFSTAWHINEFFKELYRDGGLGNDVFYVPGVDNPADAPSRSNALGDKLTARRSDIVFPSITTFQHQYRRIQPSRLWWHV